MPDFALIMAGGSGERFWPLSSADRPKQFLPLAEGGMSLLEAAARRGEALAGRDQVRIVTSRALGEATRDALPWLPRESVLEEPAKRNTLGAIMWGCANIAAREPGAAVAVLPADHWMPEADKFVSCAQTGMESAKAGYISTLGMKPTEPSTAYGYIKMTAMTHFGVAGAVECFREKPDAFDAVRMWQSGEWLWNGGMFFFTLPVLAEALGRIPNSPRGKFEAMTQAIAGGRPEDAELQFVRMPEGQFDKVVMERNSNTTCVPADFPWSDVGSWSALATKEGNSVYGEAHLLKSNGCVVHNEGGAAVSVIGCRNLVVAVHGDKVLVCDRDSAQDVREAARHYRGRD